MLGVKFLFKKDILESIFSDAIDKKRQEVYSELEEIESKIMGNYMDESYSSKDKEARQDESDDVIMADMQESASQDVDVPVDETPMEQNQHLSKCKT